MRAATTFVLILLAMGCAQRDGVQAANQSDAAQARQAVDQIGLIEGLPPKQGEPIDDPYGARIVSLGKSAGPYLVEKLTDDTPSRVVYGFQHKIGDLALILLVEIYKPRGWPFPDDSVKIPAAHNDNRDYVDFVASPNNRKQLQDSWSRYIQGK